MSTTYPGTIQTFTNPSGTSLLTSPDHAVMHTNTNDTLGAIQNTLGTTAGTALFNAFGASDKPEKKGVITMGTTAYTTSGTLVANQVLKYDGTTIIGGVAGATSPLTTKGDLYVYSTEGTRLPVGTVDGHVLKVTSTAATGLAWGAAAGTNSFIVNETPAGTPNGTLTAFTLANTPVTNTEMIFRDGQLMAGGTADYSMSAGTINFVTAPVTNSVIRASYQLAGASSGNADTVDNYHANATPTAGQIPVLDSSALLPAATIPTATDAEITTGTETAKFITPKELADATIGKIGAAWTAWTPTFTNCTVGSGSVTGYYCRIGKFITGYAQFTYGTGSSVGQAELVLPVTISSNYASFTPIGLVTFDDNGTLYNGRIYNTNYISVDTVSSTRIIHNNVSATVPFTFASGDRIKVSFTYEAA